MILIENFQNLLCTVISKFYMLWYTDVDKNINPYFIQIKENTSNNGIYADCRAYIIKPLRCKKFYQFTSAILPIVCLSVTFVWISLTSCRVVFYRLEDSDIPVNMDHQLHYEFRDFLREVNLTWGWDEISFRPTYTALCPADPMAAKIFSPAPAVGGFIGADKRKIRAWTDRPLGAGSPE